MLIITHIKAHVFHDLNAAIKLHNKNPSPKNVKLLRKLYDVKNVSVNVPSQTQKYRLSGQSIVLNIASITSDK